MCRSYCPRRRFRKAEKADFALVLQSVHCTDRVFDRHRRVDAVLIIEVDGFNAEPLQARFAGGADIFRVTANAQKLTVRAADVAELGRKEDLVAPVRDCAADPL